MEKETISPSKMRLPLIGLIALGAIAVCVAGYFAVRKFQMDQERAMNFQPRAMTTHVQPITGKPVTRTYTQKDLDEARKRGEKLPGMNLPPNLPNTSGEAAVQRSLRTLDEINRINEMNRRLLEQQQRQQQH